MDSLNRTAHEQIADLLMTQGGFKDRARAEAAARLLVEDWPEEQHDAHVEDLHHAQADSVWKLQHGEDL